MKADLLVAVARHGQTDANVKGLWVGNGDDPLNETGVRQAQLLANSLAKYGFDYIISSDKIRSIQTAQIISETIQVPVYGQKVILRDRNYGAIEGLTTEQVRKRYGIEMKSLSREIDDFDGTETVSSVLKRVEDFVSDAGTIFGGKKIIVITHGGFIRTFYETYVRDSTGIRFTNCAHFVVRFRGGIPELVSDLEPV